jgi:hypothetical protein
MRCANNIFRSSIKAAVLIDLPGWRNSILSKNMIEWEEGIISLFVAEKETKAGTSI